MAQQRDRTGAGLENIQDDADRRGFAGAIGPKESADRPRFNSEADIVHGLEVPVELRDIGKLKGSSHQFPLFRPPNMVMAILKLTFCNSRCEVRNFVNGSICS